MKILRYAIPIAALSLLSCDDKDSSEVIPAKAESTKEVAQADNKFVGEWTQVNGDNTVAFIDQGGTLLFNDGKTNFKAELSGDNTVNVDLTSITLGIVIFEYSDKEDTISALGDTFRRKQ